jgi:tocopherol O-methyltransferase
MSVQTDRVVDYYKNTRLDYWILWMGRNDLAVHFGYYDKKVNNHRKSLLRMNEVMADSVNISSKDTVLDLGCAYGGSSIWLAKTRGCQAVGLTIVPEQVEKGNQFVKKLGVANKVSLKHADYAQIPFSNQSFDVVWGLESLVHAEDRMLVYREAYRVLKDGGRLVLAEYLLRENPSLFPQEQAMIEPWLQGWAMPGLLTPGKYQECLNDAGFSSIRLKDITEFTRPSLARLDRMATLALPIAKGLHRLNLMNEVRYGNVRGSYYQNRAFAKGLWNYWVITAQK